MTTDAPTNAPLSGPFEDGYYQGFRLAYTRRPSRLSVTDCLVAFKATTRPHSDLPDFTLGFNVGVDEGLDASARLRIRVLSD